MKQVQSTKPNPQSTCEVCRAARELVQASDGLRNSGMAENKELHARAKAARDNWEYARGQRHTGTPHTPVVAEPDTAPNPAGTGLCYGLDVPHAVGLHPDQCEGCANPPVVAEPDTAPNAGATPCDYHELPHAEGCPGNPVCSLGRAAPGSGVTR